MRAGKNKTTSWHMLGLTIILVIGCLCAATGTALARYRNEFTEDLLLDVQKPAQVFLWAGSDPEAAYVEGTGEWQLQGDGSQKLSFMVTNTDDGKAPEASQEFYLRLIASQGAWDGKSDMKVELGYEIELPLDPAALETTQTTEETEATEGTEVTEGTEATQDAQATEPDVHTYTDIRYVYAKASRIKEDTILYDQFGDGWQFTFLDEDGQELTWTLEGGRRSTVVMHLILEDPALLDTSLLRLQVTGTMLDE